MNEQRDPMEPAHQPAYDAVYAYISELGDYLPPDRVHRNAVIWRAVNAALDATASEGGPTAHNGPSVAEAAADDRRYWECEKDGETNA